MNTRRIAILLESRRSGAVTATALCVGVGRVAFMCGHKHRAAEAAVKCGTETWPSVPYEGDW